MCKNFILVIIFFITKCSVAEITFASDKVNDKISEDEQKVEQVLSEYKQYLNTVAPEIRDEIIAYRKSVAMINKKKKQIYDELSQEAQSYLAEEQHYKKQLPMRKRKLVRIQKMAKKSLTE